MKNLSKFCGFLLFLLFLFTNSKVYDRIFLIVNEQVITYKEFNKEIKFAKKYIKLPGKKKIKEEDITRLVLEKMINKLLLKEIAEKEEVFVKDFEIEDRINDIMKMYRVNKKEFEKILKRQGFTFEQLREYIKEQLMLEKIKVILLRGKIKEITEEEVKAYYKKHKKEMYQPKRIRVKHILIRQRYNLPLSQQIKIEQKARRILKRALKGENFDKLVKKYSEDEASKDKGGDIGYITEGEWLPQYSKLLFKLRPGQVAPILLKSEWGWHIVKVTEVKKKRRLSFEEVRSRIKAILTQQKMNEQFQKVMKEKMNNSFIKIILSDKESYTYYYGKWRAENKKRFITTDELIKKIQKLKYLI